MNHSIYSADRTTHLKIVVIALCAAIVVTGFVICSRTGADAGTLAVVKAGKPVAVTNLSAIVVR